MSVAIRPAGEEDRALLARLHAASWRTAYRGILPDVYLDREIEAERAAHWASRSWGPADFGFVAEAEGEPVGFVFVEGEGEAAYIDNLHVLPAAKGRGVGRALMGAVGRTLPGRPVALTVYEANLGARGFYARMGGRETGILLETAFGRENRIVRVEWEDAARLAAPPEPPSLDLTRASPSSRGAAEGADR